MSEHTHQPSRNRRARSVYVIGDDPIACELAKQFDDRHQVTHVTSEDPPPSRTVETVTADPSAGDDLSAAGVGNADVALVATGHDGTNLLAGRLSFSLGADRVVALVYDPSTEDSIRQAEFETVNVTRALERVVTERVDG